MAQTEENTGAPRSGFAPRTHHLASWALVVGTIALLALLTYSDLQELWRTAASVDPWLLLAAFGCTALSYLTMTRSYQGITWAAGATTMGFADMFRITLVANTVNYLVSTGGLSGFAVRMYFFIRMGMKSDTAVIVSLLQTFLTNVVLLFCVAFGFWYMLVQHRLGGFAFAATSILLVVSVVASVLAILLLAHRQLRRRVLFLGSEAVHWTLHRFFPSRKLARVRLWRFQRNLNRGFDFLLARKRHMIMPTVWIVADWVATMGILYVAFYAVGHPVPMSVVIVGFSIGIVLSVVSLVPGGLGVLEGSMAAIFSGFGVPLEAAVVAILILRFAYYVLPGVISLFFFRGMLLQSTRAAADVADY